MTKTKLELACALFAGSLLSAGAHAAAVPLNASQLDSVAAGGVEKVDGFVCPVISTDSVLNSPKGGALGVEGYYTIGATGVHVPVHATNTLDNGRGPVRHTGRYWLYGDLEREQLTGSSR